MRFSTITLFTLSLVLTLSHTAIGQGFSISPSRIFFTGAPGETVTQTIDFTNTSKDALSFVTRIQDWSRDSTGNKVYANTLSPNSNAKWISLSENSVVIQPGEVKKVIVSLHIPLGANKLSHTMLFFTQVKPQQKIESPKVAIGVNVLMEVGVQIYYTPTGLKAGDLEFMAFEDRGIVKNGEKTVRRVAIKIYNRGEINKDAFLRLELTNKETGEEIKIEPTTVAMLPEEKQWVMVDLPANLKGKFLTVAMLDAGSSYDLKVAEKEIIYRP
jgi:hypothetical protein